MLLLSNVDPFHLQNATFIVQAQLFQTFAIGKPVDLLIYASLSRKVKSEPINLICCQKKKKKFKRNIAVMNDKVNNLISICTMRTKFKFRNFLNTAMFPSN